MKELEQALANKNKELLVGIIIYFQGVSSDKYKETYNSLMEKEIEELYIPAVNFAKSIQAIIKHNL